MPYKDTMSHLAGLISVVGFIVYIGYMAKGITKPKILSWVIWSILDTILLAGMLSAKASINDQAWTATIGSCCVTIVSLKKGMRGWNRVDLLCCIGSIVSLVAWFLTKDPMVAIVIVLTVILIGTIPLIKSVWEDPSRENWVAWLPGLIAPIFGILSLKKYNIESMGQPIIFLIIATTSILLSLRKKRQFES